MKFLENIKHWFQRTISWNKCRSEITKQSNNNNLDYLIDLTFSNINRLFVISFKNGDDDTTINSFDEYYMPLLEIKDFNTLTNNKTFFNQPLKSNNKQEEFENRNVKKKWRYNRKFIRLFLSSKML